MAGISIPIVTEFDGKGINKAITQFKQLETNSEKAQFAIKKAAVPAAAALGGLALALGDAVKGAIADEAAQKALAGQIQRTTAATDAQILANEDWISTQGKLLGVTDDELRPAISLLATQTHDLATAQKAATLAMDISAATGKDLNTVSNALAKAYGGNEAALKKLSPEIGDMIKGGATLDEVMGTLTKTFGGAASQAADTAAGRFKILKVSLDETKESIGAALLPAVEAVLPYLQSFATWAQDNPQTFTIIAGTIGAVAVAILAINTAMALNPFTAIALGIGVAIGAFVLAYKKFDTFRGLVQTIANGLGSYFEFIANAWIAAVNVIIRGINLIKPGKDIGSIGSISIGKLGGSGGGGGFTSTAQAEAAMGFTGTTAAPSTTPFTGMSPSIPQKATTAPLREGPSSIKGPGYDNRPTSGGPGYEGSGIGGIGPFDNLVVNIDVNGGDPNAVVDALRTYMRQNGSVPIKVSNIY